MNISEIAKLAGVSPATVSRYLNNGYLSDEKKERIEKIINETGYIPSQQAQTLRTGKTKLIGVIIPKIDSDSISRVVAGVTEVLSAADYQMILANTDNDYDKELEFLEIFRQTKVDGIIHLGTVKTTKHKKAFKENRIPTVVLGQEAEFSSSIYHDDYDAAYKLAKYVVSKGHKKIAYFGVTDKDVAVGLKRKAGFDASLTDEKVESYYYEGSFNMDNGYSNCEKVLKEHPDVDAIVCATDTIALGVVKYLNEKGISIPNQIGVAGMGDSKYASVLTPALTTVHYYYKECGIEGAKILLDQIQNRDLPQKKIKLDCKIVENGSM